jgi:hypothetical protein
LHGFCALGMDTGKNRQGSRQNFLRPKFSTAFFLGEWLDFYPVADTIAPVGRTQLGLRGPEPQGREPGGLPLHEEHGWDSSARGRAAYRSKRLDGK